MNAHILCLIAALSADPHVEHWQTIYSSSPALATAVRGQTTYDEDPGAGPPQDVLPAPNYPWPEPSLPGYQRVPTDPFLNRPGAMIPIPDSASSGFIYGANGPQPYRFGWTVNGDIGYLPKESVRGTGVRGHFGIFEFNGEMKHTRPILPGWIFSTSHQFNLRVWDGPGAVGLPGQVYRFGWDFVVATPANAPWSLQLALNPSLNSDFERRLTSDAWNTDGRGILFFRSSPQWMFAFGAAFLDRVNDQVIPYAGVVWTPTDRTEWRLMFPNAQISYFLGNCSGVAQWVYVAGEYHIEAYEVVEELSGQQEQIELEDWRFLIGVRNEVAGMTSFLEAGWVFGRDVSFKFATPGFDISTGFIARIGVRY